MTNSVSLSICIYRMGVNYHCRHAACGPGPTVPSPGKCLPLSGFHSPTCTLRRGEERLSVDPFALISFILNTRAEWATVHDNCHLLSAYCMSGPIFTWIQHIYGHYLHLTRSTGRHEGAGLPPPLFPMFTYSLKSQD